MQALLAALWAGLGAAGLVLGAWLGLRFRPAKTTVGRILGFGAGALLAAIAYELVPSEKVHGGWIFVALGTGALAFFWANRVLTGRGHEAKANGRSIMLGALLDGIPESLVLGMGFAATLGTDDPGISVAFLAAIFVSNLPESLGASAAMRSSGSRPRDIYLVWWSVVAVSAVSGVLGFGAVHLIPGTDGRYVEAFAAGAVLTMLADSLIPEAYRQGGKLTGLLTVLGFAAAGGLSMLD